MKRFSKKTKVWFYITVIALLLVFVSLFNSNWQLSLGLKTRADINNNNNNSGFQGEYHIDDGSKDNYDNDGKYGIDNDEEESGIPDEDAFLYSLVLIDLMQYGFDAYPAVAVVGDEDILGIGFSDYDKIFESEDLDDENSYYASGFVTLEHGVITKEIVEGDGVIIKSLVDEKTDDMTYELFLNQSIKNEWRHYIAYDQYVRYRINEFEIEVETIVDEHDHAMYDTWGKELGFLYNYDLERPVYDPDLGKPFNPPGYSLNDTVDYEAIKNSYLAFIQEQTNNGMRTDSLSTAYISMEAFNDFQANNQQESFLGLEPEEIYYIQANLDSSLFYYVDSDGVTQVLELPPDPADKATIWERIAAAVASITVIVVAIVIATATMITTAGTMSVAGSMLIGAAIGFGVEFFMQVTVNGTPLNKVDWAKVAVSTIAGALSAIPGMGWLGAGLINGGSQAAYAWLDGADFKDVLLAFGIGFATGVVIHFATKALSKITSKIEDKFGQIGQCFIAGTQVLALNVNNKIISKNIEDIQKGDTVVSYNETTGITEPKTVVQTFTSTHDELIKITTDDNQTITSSVEHPYYVQNRKSWIEAQSLRAGDILKTVNGKKVIVEQVQHEILEKTETLYNFEVEDNHDYFVGENVTVDFDSFVLVHNVCHGSETIADIEYMSNKWVRMDLEQGASGKWTIHLHENQDVFFYDSTKGIFEGAGNTINKNTKVLKALAKALKKLANKGGTLE